MDRPQHFNSGQQILGRCEGHHKVGGNIPWIRYFRYQVRRETLCLFVGRLKKDSLMDVYNILMIFDKVNVEKLFLCGWFMDQWTRMQR